MDIASFWDSWMFTWVLLPMMIFCARIVDVSVGTLRVVFISRGNKLIAPIMGFFEVIIWLIAIGQIMKNLTNVMCYIAYGGGFATGTFVGMWIVDRLTMGTSLVRVITSRDTSKLEERLRAMGYGVTKVEAEGKEGETNVMFTVIRNNDLKDVLKLVETYNPRAFYTIEDIRSAGKGKFPGKRSALSALNLQLFRPHRKGK
ncbi:MAG: DUF2179 domain-containing protein [Candidatus Thermoplasmatota archaeon]|nr:DUF2179 domain-containing protein [Candidatus Thermoplasmatota archaeon]